MTKINSKNAVTSTILVGLFLIQGCSTSGMMTARHNGKKYWNPGNCSQYQYQQSNPDKIYCVSDGRPNGVVLEPVDQQQLQNYYREREIERNSYQGGGSNGTVSCSRMGDFSFNKEIRAFTGMVCPPGWLPAF